MFFKWFLDNQMKTNIKYYLLVNKKKCETVIRIGHTQNNTEYEKLLGNKVDTKINFNENLSDIIRQVGRKVNGL